MSEQGPLRGVVVGHGALADGLVDAVRQIAGVEDALVAVSNRGLAPEAVLERVRAAVGAGPAIIFTDLLGGSCGTTSRRLCRERPDLAVVAGVNLPLLLEFVTHRDLPLPELVGRLIARGRGSVCCAPAELEANVGSPVPGR